MSDARAELEQLAREVRELLDWEETLGNPLFPEPIVPRLPASPEHSASSASTESEPASPISNASRAQRLRVLEEDARTCTQCGLHRGRTKSVFARGNPSAELVFIGEGPGYHEDQQGVPFVGRAGQLLDRMITAMNLGRDDVYICNVVKCRPPDNRTPLPNEAAACMPFLEGQIGAIQPRVIVALGKCAAQNLGCAAEQGRWRGQWREWRGFPVMSTYHPAFLLRSPQFKRQVWEDLQEVMKRLGQPVALNER